MRDTCSTILVAEREREDERGKREREREVDMDRMKEIESERGRKECIKGRRKGVIHNYTGIIIVLGDN